MVRNEEIESEFKPWSCNQDRLQGFHHDQFCLYSNPGLVVSVRSGQAKTK